MEKVVENRFLYCKFWNAIIKEERTSCYFTVACKATSAAKVKEKIIEQVLWYILATEEAPSVAI